MVQSSGQLTALRLAVSLRTRRSGEAEDDLLPMRLDPDDGDIVERPLLVRQFQTHCVGRPQERRAAALRAWADLCWRGVADSAAEYHRLQQAEAAGKAR